MQLKYFVPPLIFGAFVALAVGFYTNHRRNENSQAMMSIEQICLRQMNATRSEIRGGTTVLYSLKGLVDLSNATSPGDLWWKFATDVIGKTGWRLIGSGILQQFSAVELAAWQERTGRNATQQSSTTGLREQASLDRSEYLIIVENFPNRTSLGFDYYSETERAAAARLGAKTGNLTVSNPTSAINTADKVLIFFIPIFSNALGQSTFWGGISGAYYARNTLPSEADGIYLRLLVNDRLTYNDPGFDTTTKQNTQNFFIADKAASLSCGYSPSKSQLPYIFLALGIVSGLILSGFSIYMLHQAEVRRRDLVKRMKLDEERVLAQEREKAAVNNTRLQTSFLANMSHEVRTPLNGIMWMIKFMLQTPLQPEQREYMDNLDSSSTALLQIVNDVLDISKIEADKLEIERIPIDLIKLLRNLAATHALTASQKNNRFTSEIHVPLAERHVITDPTRLVQVINNLISNALKFSNGEVKLRCSRQDDRLVFTVADNGIGMTKEQVAKLFQPFVQADSSTTRLFGGTGLGLSICKKLAVLLGGDVSCDTKPNEGSTFTFWMPWEPAKGKEMELLRRVEQADTAVRFIGNVLLAEDNPINQKVTKKVMKEEFSLDIECVSDGQQAIDRISANPFFYNLVLMDGHMPVADGYEATRRIRELGIHVPIVAFSASAMDADKERGYAAGMDDFLSKPLVKAELARLLYKYLETSERE